MRAATAPARLFPKKNNNNDWGAENEKVETPKSFREFQRLEN